MNALSVPTWVVHVSSVLEWTAAIYYIWQYGMVTGDRVWYSLSFAMLPALVSAMCACTWHFFDNLPSLDWLVILQAGMTVVGNFTVCIAAWAIWRSSQKNSQHSLSRSEIEHE
ncbi:MAG: DUF2499 domain-containing protein [Cyanobacteria bacterium P01_C01_bin.72]